LSELEGDLKKEKEQSSKELSDNKKSSEELSKTKKDYESLRTKHDAEVQELFENKDTLKFVKQMKFYKKEWSEKTSDDERKHIATQMASSTKNWVSAPAEASPI
jgi:hypothetical protein